MADIFEATRDYERWMSTQVALVPEDIEFKHQQMRSSTFAFLRATFYRWIQTIESGCPKLCKAPKLLAVGDLHAENFGTWRDGEGRLVWGINDFDEAAWLPYTVDLVRLAVSIQLAIDANHLSLGIDEACEAISASYQKALESGGSPFVLAEQHPHLRRMATGVLRDPVAFWEKLASLPEVKHEIDPNIRSMLKAALPGSDIHCEIKLRRAGLGSLGKGRFLALGEWEGGQIAREAKELSKSAAVWASVADCSRELHYDEILSKSVRCRDPHVGLVGNWLVRRLAPDCSRIELVQLPEERDELRLVEAMGKETANIHLGSKEQIPLVLEHLQSLGHKWLRKACGVMADEVRKDFRAYHGG